MSHLCQSVFHGSTELTQPSWLAGWLAGWEGPSPGYYFFFGPFWWLFLFFNFFLFIYFISWRIITSQHFSGFCHTLSWISHGVTCIFLKLFTYVFMFHLLVFIYIYSVCVSISCSVVSDSFMTPWTAAHQAPLSIGFPRQEYWSG